MTSSISIFRGRRGKRLRGAFLAFVLASCAFFGVGHWLVGRNPDWIYRDPIPAGCEDVDSSSLYLHRGTRARIGASFYNVGGSMEWARRADVLIVGNSRSDMAFRDGMVQSFQRESGLRVFNLSFVGNNAIFMRQLIERNGLFPQIILVNQDNFFNPDMGGEEKEVLTSSWWRESSNTFTGYVLWRARYYAERMMPELNVFRADRGKILNWFYSPYTGCFYDFQQPETSEYPLGENPVDGFIKPSSWGIARQFVEWMGKRGALVIFMKVPNRTNAEKFKSEAALVGVPWVAPEVPGLRTFDGSHLNQESADRFAKEVFKELMKVPEVRRVLGEGDRDIKKAPSLEGRGLRDL